MRISQDISCSEILCVFKVNCLVIEATTESHTGTSQSLKLGGLRQGVKTSSYSRKSVNRTSDIRIHRSTEQWQMCCKATPPL